jgi:hypothetical protein
LDQKINSIKLIGQLSNPYDDGFCLVALFLRHMETKTQKKPKEAVNVVNALIDLMAASRVIQENTLALTNEDVFNELLEGKRAEAKTELEAYDALLSEAIHRFEAKDSGGVATIFLDQLRSFNGNKDFLDILMKTDKTNQIFDHLIAIAGETFNDGDFQSARLMFSLISYLFPLRIKPYIFLASIEWQETGIDAAIKIYEVLLSTFKSAFLNFCAADCFAQNGDKARATSLLKECLELLKRDENSEANRLLQESAQETLAQL